MNEVWRKKISNFIVTNITNGDDSEPTAGRKSALQAERTIVDLAGRVTRGRDPTQ